MEGIIVFYGTPLDKSDCYKYARKTYDGWDLIWFNSFDNIETRIPLSNLEINKLTGK